MFQPLGLSTLPSHRQMLRAFLASDPSAEGIFYVAVKTTGVFCRPTCTARKPSAHNVEFFATTSEAVHGVSGVSNGSLTTNVAAFLHLHSGQWEHYETN